MKHSSRRQWFVYAVFGFVAGAVFVSVVALQIHGYSFWHLDAVRGSGSDRVAYVHDPFFPFAHSGTFSFFDTPARARDALIAEKGSFVWIDLSAMEAMVYRDGDVHDVFSLAGRGRIGSWWDVPAGLYAAGAKNPMHFVVPDNVYMPWSIHLRGGFFIHGWPYYEDATPVPAAYPRGGIRLSVTDSKKMYDYITPGMPVVVSGGGMYDAPALFHGERREFTASVAAPAYIAADLESGFVFFEEGGAEPAPIASITKLMTALVASEHIALDQVISVPKDALAPPGRTVGIEEGAVINAFDLMHPLLLSSSNHAAEAVAAFLGRDHFLALMNARAHTIGMENTAFHDPSGLSAGNISTPRDLVRLAHYIYTTRRVIFDVTRGEYELPYGTDRFAGFPNYNGFRSHVDFSGGKVGYTIVARQTMLAVFEIAAPDGAVHPVAIVVLGTENRTRDTETILAQVKEVYFSGEAQ